MRRVDMVFCRQGLLDRDFLYGVFQRHGFVKDGEEFFTTAASFIIDENNLENNNVKGIADDIPDKM